MWWLVGVVVCAAGVAAYVTWTAARLKRLHARAADADAALTGKLNARAKAALLLADTCGDQLGGLRQVVLDAAYAALDALPEDREAAENDLTQVLRELPLHDDEPALGDVQRAGRRLAIAKQVHSDVVRDAVSARFRPVARVFGLAWRHPRPSYFNIDDPRWPRRDGAESR